MSVPGIMYEKCTIIIAIVKRNYMVACIVRVVLKRVRVNLVLKDNILHTVYIEPLEREPIFKL